MTTPYHARYWARLLTVGGERGSVAQLGRSLASARLDINPHQIDASLFAIRSPLSQGCMLADEVGLGKTIEAGLVIAQRWAERRRRILLILPATLRKQWQLELAEKFGLPSLIMEGRAYNAAVKEGKLNPFDAPGQVVICSYPFAARKRDDLMTIPWDLVVLDEAHRLRNVWKAGSKQAPAIRSAIDGRQKLLLTATPLQNSLMELYGLVTFIDDHVFGDLESFKERFVGGRPSKSRFEDLRTRLKSVCTRTLRRDVTEYVRFTNRTPITQEFYPTDAEQDLYDAVSTYLQREFLVALPKAQRSLMTLVLRRLLASSTFAIAGTLRRLANRLERQLNDLPTEDLIEEEADNFDGLDETADEWSVDGGDEDEQQVDRDLLSAELEELRHYAEQAEAIAHNAKGGALLQALDAAFTKGAELGAARKAVIFTESRRTQDYLAGFLADNGYVGQIVLINGSNTDPDSRQVYAEWCERHAGSDRASGSKTADMKAAIIERFRDLEGDGTKGALLIATESAAEGVNMQFCSLLVNYDLPWNPQRVEQRIGRCHRYGQQHDVVVVNFINKRNEADQRVYELLNEKFQLFEGIFGASDEILGQLESGVDIERRIAAVYQSCRTSEAITAAFDQIQSELDDLIQSRMAEVRSSILEHFDADVQERLRIHKERAMSVLDDLQCTLLNLARFELDGDATFTAEEPAFTYHAAPYHFDWRIAETRNAHHFSPEHPLAQQCIDRALKRELARDLGQRTRLICNLTGHHAPVAALESHLGRSGWIGCAHLAIKGAVDEQFVILSGVADDGARLDTDQCRRLLELAVIADEPATDAGPEEHGLFGDLVAEKLAEVEARNSAFLDEEAAKLDRWAEDLRTGLELDLKQLDRDIKEAKKNARAAPSLAIKVDAHRRIKDMERLRHKKRQSLFEEQDQIESRREDMIAQMEQLLQQGSDFNVDFLFQWSLT